MTTYSGKKKYANLLDLCKHLVWSHVSYKMINTQAALANKSLITALFVSMSKSFKHSLHRLEKDPKANRSQTWLANLESNKWALGGLELLWLILSLLFTRSFCWCEPHPEDLWSRVVDLHEAGTSSQRLQSFVRLQFDKLSSNGEDVVLCYVLPSQSGKE